MKVRGLVYAKRREGRRVWRAYFVLIADGRLAELWDARGKEEVEFEGEVDARSLLVIGKSGPSGLEGFPSEGGGWVRAKLVRSGGRNSIRLSLPPAWIEVSGGFEVKELEGRNYGEERKRVK